MGAATAARSPLQNAAVSFPAFCLAVFQQLKPCAELDAARRGPAQPPVVDKGAAVVTGHNAGCRGGKYATAG